MSEYIAMADSMMDKGYKLSEIISALEATIRCDVEGEFYQYGWDEGYGQGYDDGRESE